MNAWSRIPESLQAFVPVLAIVALIAASLALIHWLLLRRRLNLGAEARFPRQLLLLAMTAGGLLVILLVFPMSETTRGQILSLTGLVLTAVIGLSSTSFVSNIMAGLMLRVVKSFRPGDFIQIGDNFGRVTERGLVHTEIQTQNRDLTTFPNLHLVTNPVTVVRSSGTIVSTTLSLGYDLLHSRVEALLKSAAEEAGLQDAFVQVQELGDFSVTYRVAGFLPKVKHLLTVRSDLRKKVLDSLHGDGIEIVSPTFMNQRRLADNARIIPRVRPDKSAEPSPQPDEVPEKIIFDKAEAAESLEHLQREYAEIKKRIDELKSIQKSAEENTRLQLQSQIDWLQKRAERMARHLETVQKTVND